MTTTMRPIDASTFKAPQRFSPGGAPILQWIKITDLVVDDGYQRPIYGAGTSNVRKIADGFFWSKFAPVIVAPVEGGKFAIIDGQHRTTAAAVCGVESVPCQVVIASAAEQAEAFRAINGQVTRIHSLALQHAALQSGDPEALAVDEAAREADVTIVRYPKQMLAAGETMALGTIRSGMREFDRETVVTALRCFTRTSNHKPGVLKAMSMRAVIAVLASNIRWRDGGGAPAQGVRRDRHRRRARRSAPNPPSEGHRHLGSADRPPAHAAGRSLRGQGRVINHNIQGGQA